MDKDDRVNQILMEEDSDEDDHLDAKEEETRMNSLFSNLEIRISDEEEDLHKTHQPLNRNKFILTKPDSDDDINAIEEDEKEDDIDTQKDISEPIEEMKVTPASKIIIDKTPCTSLSQSMKPQMHSTEVPTDRQSLFEAIMEKENNNDERKTLVKNIINSVDSDEEEIHFEITEEEK